MLKRVNRLNEEILPKEKKNEVINNFIEFVKKEIGMNDVPEIEISYDNKIAQDMRSFGKYTPENNELLIVATNRNLADILRTIAHELIHHKQFSDGKITHNSNDTGSDVENEANSLAGIIMRKFAKLKPIIFE